MAITPFSDASSPGRMSRRRLNGATSSRGCTYASEIHHPNELRIPLEKFLRIFALEGLPQLLLDHRRIRDGLGREVIVRIEVQLLDEPARGICRVREFAQFVGRIEVVVAVF